jgi:hypothetical protein
MPSTKNPGFGIGPQTKRETKKTARVAKRADRKIITPLTPTGTAAAKAAKKKERMKTIGAALGVAGATVGTMLADARFTRGANRVRGNSNKKVSAGDAWRAGKNKKSTKK